MGKIWIAGYGFDIDARVVRWDEGPGYNGMLEKCIQPRHPCVGGVLPYSKKRVSTRTRRFAFRPSLRRYGMRPPLRAAQAVIRQCILHHDGCPSADVCFHVLHNERGLSCHFLLDNDGTIYQTLDLAVMGFHAAGFNRSSIGIEISSRGNAKGDVNYYRRRKQRRNIVTCRIHGHTYLCFDFADAQKDALQALAKGLSKILPNCPLEYPQSTPGKQSWEVLNNAKQYSGYLGHYHTTRRKWDPGPFDFKSFCENIRGGMCFPLWTPGSHNTNNPPVIPKDVDTLRQRASNLYAENELSAEAGYFPVGPFGDSRLWHGGVHLAGKYRQKLFAPFAGRIVAARMAKSTGAGSTSFVLLRHDITLGAGTVRFYSLYFHLYNEGTADNISRNAPDWVTQAKSSLFKKQVTLLDIPVQGGTYIGRIGKAGPNFENQVHFEIFAPEEILGDLGKGVWEVIDGTSGGRFSDSKHINQAIDISPKDGKLSRKELLDFFRQGDKSSARYLTTLHVSEWTAEPDWQEALSLSADYGNLSKDRLQTLVDTQITPGLWWTQAVATHAKLPRDGVVYHYHPISFLRFVSEKMIEAQATASDGVNAFAQSDAEAPPDGVTDDIGDETGESFVDDSELLEQNRGQDLTLEDLVKGFTQ